MARIVDVEPPELTASASGEFSLSVEFTVAAGRTEDIGLVLIWPGAAAGLRLELARPGLPLVEAASAPGTVRLFRSRIDVPRPGTHVTFRAVVQGIPPALARETRPLLVLGTGDHEFEVVVRGPEWGWPAMQLPRARGRRLTGQEPPGSGADVTDYGYRPPYTGVHVPLSPRPPRPGDYDDAPTAATEAAVVAESASEPPQLRPDPPFPAYQAQMPPTPPYQPQWPPYTTPRPSTSSEPPSPVAMPLPTARPRPGARPTPPAAMAGPAPAPRPVVGTGFAEAGPEARNLPADRTLETGGRYRFWLQIGPEHPSSIERKPKALPSTVPVGSLLTVTLVGASEGAEVLSPAEAELCLLSDGAMPARPQGPTLSPQERRLFFEVRTPPVPGEAQWRCSIYWRGGLVQSRLVRAVVTPGSFVLPRALSSELDYSLADPGDPATLAEVGEHDGSLTLSGRSDATHVLTIRAGTDSAGPPLRAELRLDEGTIAQAIRRARAALRTAAWGDEEPWDERRPEQRYRHTLRADPARLAADLTGLAVAGYRLHWTLAQELAREAGTDLYAARDLLASALGRAGTVQVAVLRSARHVLPAALLYDLPLDTNAPALTLCPDFAEAYRNGPAAVGGAPCFSGGCRQAVSPSLTVVCPAGFWGFRHSLGLPLSAGPGRSAVARLTVDEPFRIGIGLYTGFPTAQFHCEALAALRPGTEVRTARSRAEVGGMLAGSPSPHLVYFYCHGGLTASGTPFLRVGDDRSDEVLTPDNLYAWGVHWSDPRPLVFLNGCRTADLEPEQLLDFAGSFVTAAGASGLIGTEITVFEEMAGAFAKEFLRLFLDGRPAGEAVLLARRGLLAQGNPLGLAYVPFLPPQLTVGGEPARWRQRIGSSLKTRISRSTRA